MFNVILKEVGINKVEVIKAIRDVTTLGLKEAKDLVEATPSLVRGALSKGEAETVMRRLEVAGAIVELKPLEGGGTSLKEKLEVYKNNKTVLMLPYGVLANATFGRVEEVGDDYIVFRSVVIEKKESWFSDDISYKYSGTTMSTIPFTSLKFSVHPEMEWANAKFREAELNDQKKRGG